MTLTLPPQLPGGDGSSRRRRPGWPTPLVPRTNDERRPSGDPARDLRLIDRRCDLNAIGPHDEVEEIVRAQRRAHFEVAPTRPDADRRCGGRPCSNRVLGRLIGPDAISEPVRIPHMNARLVFHIELDGEVCDQLPGLVRQGALALLRQVTIVVDEVVVEDIGGGRLAVGAVPDCLRRTLLPGTSQVASMPRGDAGTPTGFRLPEGSLPAVGHVG